jgi:SAM-dependent methyltransferase
MNQSAASPASVSLQSAAFLMIALLRHGAGYVLRPLRRVKRGTDYVLGEYDKESREEFRGVAPSLATLHDLLYDDAVSKRLVLLQNRCVRGTISETREYLLEQMAKRIHQYASSGTVVEFGCGTGRNLFFLKQRFPHLRFIGLELSPRTVQGARQNAERYNLSVEFHQADIATAIVALPPDVAVAYSCHALEQTPKTFKAAADQIIACASRAALFYEPCAELYPWNVRGIASRLRIYNADYVRGLYLYLKNTANVVSAHRLGFAGNPLNETCEIIVETFS